MPYLNWIMIIVVCFVQLSTASAAADSFDNFQRIYKSATSPALWPLTFSANSYSHCELVLSSSRNSIQNVTFGICSFDDGKSVYKAPCYLQNAALPYGFSLDKVSLVDGYTVKTVGTELTVATKMGLVVAHYRLKESILSFYLGTNDPAYGICTQ